MRALLTIEQFSVKTKFVIMFFLLAITPVLIAAHYHFSHPADPALDTSSGWQIEDGTLQQHVDASSEPEQPDNSQAIVDTMLLITTVFTLFVSIVAFRSFLKPLQGLHDIIDSIGAERPRDNVNRRDVAETRLLVETLNKVLIELTEKIREVEAERDHALELVESRYSLFTRITHDMRTPMHAIIGFADGCLDHMDDEEKLDRYIRNIKKSGHRLNDMVDNILDVMKLEAGRMPIHPEWHDFSLLVRTVISDLEPLVNDKGLKLRFSAPYELKACFDYGLMFQVMTNLLSNAIKFSPTGGVIGLRSDTAHEVLSAELEPVMRFRIVDQGPGIPDEDRERVFETFYQSGAGERSHGSGVGLTICKEIVELHGGRIRLLEKRNLDPELQGSAGACFEVQVPLQPNSHSLPG